MDKKFVFSDISWSPIDKYRGRGNWKKVRDERSKINELEKKKLFINLAEKKSPG